MCIHTHIYKCNCDHASWNFIVPKCLFWYVAWSERVACWGTYHDMWVKKFLIHVSFISLLIFFIQCNISSEVGDFGKFAGILKKILHFWDMCDVFPAKDKESKCHFGLLNFHPNLP